MVVQIGWVKRCYHVVINNNNPRWSYVVYGYYCLHDENIHLLYRTEEEESSLRSSAIDESGTAKSSLTHGTGNRNTNGHGGMGGNTGLYGINDRSNPGSIATTPQSLTPERYEPVIYILHKYGETHV